MTKLCHPGPAVSFLVALALCLTPARSLLGQSGKEGDIVEKSTETPAPPSTSKEEEKAGIGSWTQYRGDFANSGVSHSPRPKYQGLKWKYFVGSPMTSTPAIAAGKVVVPSEAGYVNAIDAKTGTKAWLTKLSRPKEAVVHSSPLIFGGRVYVCGKSGTFYALDLETGRELFAVKVSEKEIYSSPKGDARGIVFGTVDESIVCLDPGDGRIRWRVPALREIGSTPTILGDSVFIPGKDRILYEIDINSGEVRKRHALPGTTHCTMPVGAGFGFFSTGGNKAYGYDLLEGKVVWEAAATSDDQTAAAYTEGVAYLQQGQFVWAVEATSGRKLWEFKAPNKVTPFCLNGDDLLLAGRDKTFRVLDRKTGNELYSLNLGEGFHSGPILVDGVVYIAADVTDGMHVYAIE